MPGSVRALLVAGGAGVFLAVFTLALSVQSLLLERRRAHAGW
jgi:hypothetical protein